MQAPIFPPGSFAANRRLLLYAAFFLIIVVFLSSCKNPDAKPAAADQPAATAPKPAGPTNKDIYKVFNTGNDKGLDTLVAKDAIDHSPFGTSYGLDSLKLNVAASRAAFPDLKIEALEEIVQGDMIMTRFRFTGTNTGPMNGKPATGRKIDVTGVDVTRTKDGKLYEHWDYTDYMTFFKQLGIDPLAPVSDKKTGKSR
ncbi:MAG: ester cyclase [Puia sp.]|nr:ester cyclase [Puia sp.]